MRRPLATRREALSETALLSAARSLDILIARVDRIMTLEGHRAGSIETEEFRTRMRSRFRHPRRSPLSPRKENARDAGALRRSRRGIRGRQWL